MIMNLFRLLSLLCIFFLVQVALVESSSASTQTADWVESYWHYVLPNIQFPKALHDIIQIATPIEGKNTYVGVGKDALTQSYNNGDSPDEALGGNIDGDSPNQALAYEYDKTQKLGGNTDSDSPELLSYDQPCGKTEDDSPQGLVHAYVSNKTSQETHHDDRNNIFFVQNALRPGQELTLRFPVSKSKAKFLPRKVATTIPFTSKELEKILKQFGIKPESVEADTVRKTLNLCDTSAIEGEVKLCATSPESLIDFGVSILGKHVRVYTTEMDKDSSKLEKYRIINSKNGVQKIAERTVVCHKQNYLYGIFYCHDLKETKAFSVLLVGSNGSKVKGVALCHYDTRFWNPHHLAFKTLNVKPGTIPICHFLPKGHIVWVPNTTKN